MIPAEFDPAYGMQPELGAMARESGRLRNAQYNAQLAGAENLLIKAMRSLAAGNTDRAEALISRAAQAPYDDREEDSPGVRAAAMLVDGIISDQLELAAEGDTNWLDVVFEVFPSLDPLGRAEAASVVHGFLLQEWSAYTLSAAEKRRIEKAFGDAPIEADRGDSPDSTIEQRHAVIRSLTMAATTLAQAYAESHAAQRI